MFLAPVFAYIGGFPGAPDGPYTLAFIALPSLAGLTVFPALALLWFALGKPRLDWRRAALTGALAPCVGLVLLNLLEKGVSRLDDLMDESALVLILSLALAGAASGLVCRWIWVKTA